MILVCGATGVVGAMVVSDLLAQGEQVRAMTRHPDTAELPDGVEIVGGDLDDPDSLGPAFDGCERVFVASNGNVTQHDTSAARAARAARARQLVKLSVVGAEDPERGRHTPARMHLAGEQAVQEAGLDWTFLRPGAFMSNTLGWAEQLRDANVVRAPFARVLAAPVDPRDVARVATLALTDRLPSNSAYPLSGPQLLSPADQVAQLAEALGRELTCEPVPDETVKQGMIDNGMPPEMVDALFSHLDAARPEARVYPTVEQVTGSAATSFADWLADNLEAFTGQ